MVSAAVKEEVKQLVSQIQQSGLAQRPRVAAALQQLLQKLQAASTSRNTDQLYQKASQIWNLAQGDPKAFVNYLQQVPDPELNALTQDRGQLETIVRKLIRSDALQKTQAPGDGMPPAPFQSSNVAGFRYDKNNQQLYVKFHNGGVYQYDGVPAWAYKLFATGSAKAKTSGKNKYGSWWKNKSPSLGASVWQFLRNGGYSNRQIR